MSDVNASYDMFTTYPFALVIPKSIRDKDLLKACTFHARCRVPVISWCDKRAVFTLSSQPLVGLMMNMSSNADENLVGALCTRLSSEEVHQLKEKLQKIEEERAVEREENARREEENRQMSKRLKDIEAMLARQYPLPPPYGDTPSCDHPLFR